MDDLYENIEETNSNEKQKKLSVFDDIIANILSNQKLQQIEREIFIRELKNCSNKKYYSKFMKIWYKRELQQIKFNHPSDIDFEDFTNVYKNCLTKPFFFSDWNYSCIR